MDIEHLLKNNKHLLFHSESETERVLIYSEFKNYFKAAGKPCFDIGEVASWDEYIGRVESVFPVEFDASPKSYDVINDIQLDWVQNHPEVYMLWPEIHLMTDKEALHQLISDYLTQKVILNEWTSKGERVVNTTFIMIGIGDNSLLDYFDKAKVFYGYADQNKTAKDLANENILDFKIENSIKHPNKC